MRFVRIFALALLLIPASSSAGESEIDWSSLGKPGVARKYLDQFLMQAASNPKDVNIRIRACEFSYYTWRGELDPKKRLQIVVHAHKLAKEAIELDSQNAAAWYWRGAALALVGLTQGALNSLQLIPEGKKAMERALELDPGFRDGTGLANLGRLYYTVPSFPVSLGDKAKAKELLLKGAKEYPESTYFPLYLADLAWAEGDNELALKYLQEVQAKKPRPNDYTAYLTPVNQKKARELEKMIRAGKKRHPFNDVLSDHAFAGILN